MYLISSTLSTPYSTQRNKSTLQSTLQADADEEAQRLQDRYKTQERDLESKWKRLGQQLSQTPKEDDIKLPDNLGNMNVKDETALRRETMTAIWNTAVNKVRVIE